MRFDNAFLSVRHVWSSPFVRWQGSLADVSSLDAAHVVARDALARVQFDVSRVNQLVLGNTIPQPQIFYGVPWLAARLGMTGISGPLISQACATSVACLVAAAQTVQLETDTTSLVICADRTSNGPLLVYPRSQAMGGSPATENWVLDNFSADPWTGQSMVQTAEAVAREGQMTRAAIDELVLLRFAQYQRALANDRAFQRNWMQAIALPNGRANSGKSNTGKSDRVIDADEGIHPYTAEGLAALKPVLSDGLTTYGSQTHPADGNAGALVCNAETARVLADGAGVVQIVAAGFARAEKARMPKAATTAALAALHSAGISAKDLKCVTTHNPFAVNDLWFAQQTGFALDRMNPYGCSLIFGHPQGPTGLRSIIELVYALREMGGGLGLFTGCAAGDTGAALVVKVD